MTEEQSSTEVVQGAEAVVEKQPEELYAAGFGEEPKTKESVKKDKPTEKAVVKDDEKHDDKSSEKKEDTVDAEKKTGETKTEDNDNKKEDEPKSALDRIKEKHGPKEDVKSTKGWHEMSKEEKIAELKGLGVINDQTETGKKEDAVPATATIPKDIPAYYKSIGLDKHTIMAPDPEDPNQEVKEMSMDEFAAKYPEVATNNVIFGEALIQSKIKSGELITKEQLSKIQADVQSQLDDIEFTMSVSAVHSDYAKINGDSKFKSWVQSQPAYVERACNSGDVEDAIAVVDAYKESLAKAAKSKNDQTAAERKKDVDKLHENTIRSTPKNDEVKEKGDFNSGFNEEVK